MSRVSFENVQKVYDDSFVAVEDFTLELADGEFLTIVGPSGSGKSTALRMVAGLEDITGGSIYIDDDEINNVRPQDRGVAMVFQNYALYPHMSVRKNMSYGLKLTTNLSGDEIEERVDEAAEMLGIEDLLEDKPGQLSGGQQQRVATGRAIVREPKVFLMDEPLSNLDAKLRTHMRIELQRLHEELQTTMIYVTHDQEEALTMSDRIAILDGGELQQVGTPEDVYERPENLFVADFIGSPSMNFFDVSLEGQTLWEEKEDFAFDLPAELAETVAERADADTLRMGIRPENIALADGTETNTITATIDVFEPVGSDNYLYLDTGTNECIARVPGDVKPDEGSDVQLTFSASDLHLFDPETERNLLLADEQPVQPAQ